MCPELLRLRLRATVLLSAPLENAPAMDQLQPEHVLAVSMFSLLALGGLAQYMQSRGGAVARYAPVVVLAFLLLISIGGMWALTGSLYDLRDAAE